MAIILAQAVIQVDSGLPEDSIVNTFHFSGAATSGVGAQLAADIEAFYDQSNGGGPSVSEFFSPEVQATGGLQIKFYDVTNGPGGSPFYTSTPADLNAPASTTAIPTEVALCLSYRANPVPGGIAARRRGRVYIGPFNATAITTTSGVCRPVASLTEALLDAAEQLHADAVAQGAPWVVYSRANDSVANIDVAWVDNAWDTQRRRGAVATSRDTRVL